jgi:LytR cell envelope-related transcriptional attenuator
MDLIQNLGGVLGLLAFVGLAVLVLLYFQQAREVRRLRDWAGRAPERAAAAAEAAEEAAAESAAGAAGEPVAGDRAAAEPGAPASEPPLGQRLRGRLPSGLGERFDTRRLPEARYLVAIGAGVVLIAVGIATGAFGLLGGDEKGGGKKGGGGGAKPDVPVAVLNGTSGGGVTGVPGLARKGAQFVKQDGFKVGTVTDAPSSSPFATSLVMYLPGFEEQAKQVADGIKKQFGKTQLQQMDPEIKSKAGGAKVALVIGSDDSRL